MTSSVWLNFFYQTQIVPAHRALFMWIKKNIKAIIYCILLFERILTLCDCAVVLIDLHASNYLTPDGFSYNSTVHHNMVYSQIPSPELGIALLILICLLKTHYLICLCVMVMSSGSTVVYLCKHMRRMAANGQPFSCPRLRSQVRVTITGILQGVLYVFCAIWTMYKIFSGQISTIYGFSYAHFTVINLYMTGTTFNLGAGQGVFRQRAADIWLRAAEWCKAPKVQESEQGG
ncbi:taste receptor, type 2, member 201, tandem duplicate 1 [Chaetodon trifascialis]|uniref:taste receptor, type 2, member 201, tandem duplicate 1 n=1 Tax=Chaetodon trifascialis TaxID=109706 RepID=UPI003996ABAC